MSEIYRVTGKTVDEAMEKAAALYGGTDKEISYDIISLPKKGFLGIGSKEAVISVTVTGSSEDALHSIVDEIKGYKEQTAPENGYYAESEQEKKEAKPVKEQKKQPKPEAKASPAQNKEKPVQKTSEKPAEKAEEKSVEKSADKPAEKKPDAPKKKKPQNKNNKPKAETQAAPEQKSEAALTEKADSDKKYAVSTEEMTFAIGFINSVIADMKLSASAEVQSAPEGEDFICTEGADLYPAIEIVGDDTGILIGHHGETLDAIQYLVNLALFRRSAGERGGRESIKITVDIENYRAKREETLRTLARRMAAKAVKYKRNVFLEPMNPYERRIIHSELQDYPDVSTHSVGSDVNRKIVVTYEGADKQPQRRRNGKGNQSKGGQGRGGRGGERAAAHGTQASRTAPAAAVAPEVPITPATPEAMPLPTLDD